MILYDNIRLIRAGNKKYDICENDPYDKIVADAICSKCGSVLGEQVKREIDKGFHYIDGYKHLWFHCPMCGEKLHKF